MNDYCVNNNVVASLSREEICDRNNRSVNAIINDTACTINDINCMLDSIIACISRGDACNKKDDARPGRDDIIGTAMLNLELAFEARAKLERIYKLLGV